MNIVMLFVSPEDVLAQIKTLPTSPLMLPRLLAMLDNPNSGLGELAQLVRLERSLAARVVRMANGSLYAGATTCDNIEDALQRIGYATAHRLASSLLGLELMSQPLRAYRCSAAQMARQAIAGACAARAVAGLINEEPNRAYLLGLMHNVGMVMLDRLIQQKEPGARLPRGTGFDEWRESEMKMFGFDQADAAADMLRAWQFPPHLVKAIRCQFRVEAAGRERPLAAIVQAARWVSGQVNSPATAAGLPPAGLASVLGCQSADLTALAGKLWEEVARLWSELGLDELEASAA